MKLLFAILAHTAVYVSLACFVSGQQKDDSDTHENCENDGRELVDHWMEVPVDHFNLFDNRTWKMRYLVNKKYFRKNGPMFIEIGGEAVIYGCNIVDSNQLTKLARKHRGVLIQTEHRYYGKSLPLGKNFTTENLKYLQMEQALEDLAYFIEKYKEHNPRYNNSKVIVHGCSYAGMLATWIRLRFSHIVDIAYASSAPLGVGLEYREYEEVVGDTYANVSSECINTIKRAFNATRTLYQSEEGKEIIKDAFKDWKCGNIENMDAEGLLESFEATINVQNDPYEFEDVACLVMSMDMDDVDAFRRFAKFFILKTNLIEGCEDDDKEAETNLEEDEEEGEGNQGINEEEEKEEEAWNTIKYRDGRAWNYQVCTEQGTFVTLYSNNSKTPFSLDVTLENEIQECADWFDGLVTESVLKTGFERVNRRYGGKRPKVTKVLTIQGTTDPWKYLASLEDYNSEAPVWLIKGSHCIDIDENEIHPTLIEIRKKIRDHISKWIKEIS